MISDGTKQSLQRPPRSFRRPPIHARSLIQCGEDGGQARLFGIALVMGERKWTKHAACAESANFRPKLAGQLPGRTQLAACAANIMQWIGEDPRIDRRDTAFRIENGAGMSRT